MGQQDHRDEGTPRLSLVIPTYGVEKYLPAFLESLSSQSVSLDALQMIFVDDGSPDRSARIIREWADANAPHTVVLSKENGGASSARNAALSLITAEWVTFPDPDDVFDPEYFRAVLEFLESPGNDVVDMLATRLLLLDDATGEVSDSHPLRRKFRRGTQIVDLSRHPEYIHLQSASAFYRTGQLLGLGLTFDDFGQAQLRGRLPHRLVPRRPRSAASRHRDRGPVPLPAA